GDGARALVGGGAAVGHGPASIRDAAAPRQTLTPAACEAIPGGVTRTAVVGALLGLFAAGPGLRAVPAGERIQVRDGEALMATFTPHTPPATRGVPVTREVMVAGHRVIEVRIPVSGSARQEVWLA